MKKKNVSKTKRPAVRAQRMVSRHSGWILIESLFVLLLIGIVGLIVFVIGDCLTGTTQPENAVVVGKAYKPPETNTGVGTGVGANGQVTTLVTTSSTSEEWNVIVRLESGEIVATKASSRQWAEAKDGQEVTVEAAIGGWSHSVLGRTLR